MGLSRHFYDCHLVLKCITILENIEKEEYDELFCFIRKRVYRSHG